MSFNLKLHIRITLMLTDNISLISTSFLITHVHELLFPGICPSLLWGLPTLPDILLVILHDEINSLEQPTGLPCSLTLAIFFIDGERGGFGGGDEINPRIDLDRST